MQAGPGLAPGYSPLSDETPRRWPCDASAETCREAGPVLWVIAVVLLVLWAIGYFIVHIGDVIHALVVLAVVLILGNVLRGIGKRPAA